MSRKEIQAQGWRGVGSRSRVALGETVVSVHSNLGECRVLAKTNKTRSVSNQGTSIAAPLDKLASKFQVRSSFLKIWMPPSHVLLESAPENKG